MNAASFCGLGLFFCHGIFSHSSPLLLLLSRSFCTMRFRMGALFLLTMRDWSFRTLPKMQEISSEMTLRRLAALLPLGRKWKIVNASSLNSLDCRQQLRRALKIHDFCLSFSGTATGCLPSTHWLQILAVLTERDKMLLVRRELLVMAHKAGKSFFFPSPSSKKKSGFFCRRAS